jgi:hypothetical protein
MSTARLQLPQTGLLAHGAVWMLICAATFPAAAVAQDSLRPRTPALAAEVRQNGADSKAKQPRDLTPESGRIAKGKMRPFYDFSFHSVSDPATINYSDYLVDERFWGRRPTLLVITPVSPNVLQPDETYAEAITETLLRQIGADLGVREAHDQVSQTIDLFRKLRKKPKKTDGTEPEQPPVEKKEPSGVEQAKAERAANTQDTELRNADARGLQTVQIVLLADTRPIWNGMSLFDRSAVVDRSLKEFLAHVPSKREKLLGYLEPDQFRFAAYLGKESINPLMDSLGLKRPDFYTLIIDRDGSVIGAWNKSTYDAKQISAAYIRAGKDR